MEILISCTCQFFIRKYLLGFEFDVVYRRVKEVAYLEPWEDKTSLGHLPRAVLHTFKNFP